MEATNRFHDVQLTMRAPADLVGAIDDYRSQKRPILSRSEAIRVLVDKALEAEQPLQR
jgi:metal-responsive CopG/Arc/MetJ family transcriptional regulator